MPAEQKPVPDRATIRDHLHHITRRWHELDEPVLLELVHLTAEDRARVYDVAHFGHSPDEIDRATEHAAILNGYGLNSYATVNPVAEARRPRPSHRADASAIAAAFFHWADADSESAAAAIKTFVGPRCTFVAVTGTQPCPRPHVYWELEEPARNLDAWSQTQRAIAATLGTDPAVVDPPRIMRIGGSVNWPKPQKQAKGYVAERVALRIYSEDDRPRVTSEQMARVFPAASRATPSATGGFDFDTGGDFPAPLDRERTRIQALSGSEWHNAVIRLVASYVAKGLSDAEIHALTQPLTLPGYTAADTAHEVQVAIDGARRKGWSPEKPAAAPPMSEEERAAIPPALFRPWVQINLATIPAPEFVYSDFYARNYTSVTLAAPKVGKSMLGLAEGLDMATGRGFLTGVRREPLRVVYYNAEDDQAVINGRVAALLTHYNIPQSELIGRFWPTSGVEADDFYMVAGQEAIINEALFVSIENFCKETNADVLIFDPLQDLTRSPETNEVFRILGQRLRRMANACGVALGLIHHTRKVAPGITPSIDDMRGGSALRGTARFNRILISMTEDEAAKAGVENHRHYMRIGDVESNLAPPSSEVNRWFQKISVETPNGQYVGAVEPWGWPDAFSGITPKDAARVRAEVDKMAEPPRADVRSAAWVGNIVADVLGLNLTAANDKARVKSIVAKWVETDVLRIVEGRDPRAGRPVNVVVSGANNPLAEDRT